MSTARKRELQRQLDSLEDARFYHEMKDHWDRHDFDYSYELDGKIKKLKKEIEDEPEDEL